MLHKLLPSHPNKSTAIVVEDFLHKLKAENPLHHSVTYESAPAIPMRQADVYPQPIQLKQADVFDSPIQMQSQDQVAGSKNE